MHKNTKRIFLFLFGIVALLQVKSQERDMAKERLYIQKLEAINPTLVDLFKQATSALDSEDNELADELFSKIYDKAPNFDIAIRRLGGLKVTAGKFEEGLALCEKAVNLDSSYENLITYAQCLIAASNSKEIANESYLNKAKSVLGFAYKMPTADDFEVTAFLAQIYIQSNQYEDFKTATQSLMKYHPDKMISHYYQAIIYQSEEEWSDAKREILEAKELGLEEESVERFLDGGINEHEERKSYFIYFLYVVGVWILGFLILYLGGILLSNYTLNAVEKEFKMHGAESLSKSIKKVYTYLINVAGIYYYISLPIILVLLVLVVIGIGYAFIMLGRIPIQLMFILIAGAGYSIYGMVKSLLVKAKAEDPGRELTEEEAPALYALTNEVANTMGTRPIDEIRITPETDLAVYENGTRREKMLDKSKRILILGTGVLKDFKVNDFKAVLAHEYGHFSNRDTAGGAVAMRVRNDMHKYSYALYLSGQTVWWNLAYLFLKAYDFIFRKISNGSTRLQEILADRVAAQTYGAQSFQNGLTYVIRRNIEFIKLANTEINEARETKRSFSNLYELTGGTDLGIEEEVNNSLNRQTSSDDTHPSPNDRFRFIEGLGAGKDSKEDHFVRDLFEDWNALTQEMTKNIEDSWKEADSLEPEKTITEEASKEENQEIEQKVD
ncbi:MAG: M48 family metalloprotease [Bacteroidia bacterium]|nr:M48 family metalloprotease [Bacteroidia bacterium]MCF8428394.1 M48 family metalloprotease [Bacteroidia bacterium]